MTVESWPDIFAKYTTISGLADEAQQSMDNYEVGSEGWYKAWGRAEGLRTAAIEILSKSND